MPLSEQKEILQRKQRVYTPLNRFIMKERFAQNYVYG